MQELVTDRLAELRGSGAVNAAEDLTDGDGQGEADGSAA